MIIKKFFSILLLSATYFTCFSQHISSEGSVPTYSGDIYHLSGKIGIGTSSPLRTLHVQGGDILLRNSANKSIHFRVDSQNSYISNKDNFVGNGSSGNGNFIFISQNNFGFRTGSANSTGTPRMTIKENGYVGIGTENPTFGRLQITQSSDASDKGIAILNTTSQRAMRLWTDSNNSYVYSGSTGNGNLVLNGDGKVGIGVASPQAKLDIGILGDGAQLLKLSMSRPWVFIQSGSDGPAASLALKALSGEKFFRIQSHVGEDAFNINAGTGDSYFKGSLSIGGINPQAVLDIKSTGDNAKLLMLSTARPWVFKQSGAGPESQLALQSTVGGKKFHIQNHLGKNLFTFDTNSGGLAIGKDLASHELDVNGTIHAKEVLVDLNFPGPDYVFEEDYDLTSLEELDSYLKENKHLPEVPSAAQMKEEGVNMVEMDMLLLKKVEELTLYLIKQNIVLESQRDQIKHLSNELDSLKNR